MALVADRGMVSLTGGVAGTVQSGCGFRCGSGVDCLKCGDTFVSDMLAKDIAMTIAKEGRGTTMANAASR